MEQLTHERFIAGNQELREILQHAERLENESGSVTEEDLQMIGSRLLNLTPEIGDASRGETLDAMLLDEVAEYVKNLRSLQRAIEKIHRSPAHPAIQQESTLPHIDSLQRALQNYLRSA